MIEPDRVMDSELQPQLEVVRSFVERNIVKARNGRRCVDGRYNPQEAGGLIATPGADLGYVMALLAISQKAGLNLDPRGCFDVVYGAVTRNGHKFYIHTDHHSKPMGEPSQDEQHQSQPRIGCGHVLKATDPDLAGAYGLEGNQVGEVLDYLDERVISGDKNIEVVNLHGDHKEKGVVIVSGLLQTINPSESAENMYFVYDKVRNERYIISVLIPRIQGVLQTRLGLSGLNFDNYMEAFNKQLNATLKNLASGKPIWGVNVDYGTEVSYLSRVA